MMQTSRFWKLLLFSTAVLAVAAAPHYAITRPRVLCGIPDRDYQFKQLSQPIRSVSAVGVPLRPVVPQAPGAARRVPAIKSYQFVETSNLKIDHCSLSNLSVLLADNGNWTVSFQADQNPREAAGGREVTTAERTRLATSHLRRNQFQVRLKCYAGYGAAVASPRVGRPVVVPIDLDPFWVQNGVPLPYHAEGFDGRIADYHDVIDRVEIEFWYRRD